jgi:hypothetical protein
MHDQGRNMVMYMDIGCCFVSRRGSLMNRNLPTIEGGDVDEEAETRPL